LSVSSGETLDDRVVQQIPFHNAARTDGPGQRKYRHNDERNINKLLEITMDERSFAEAKGKSEMGITKLILLRRVNTRRYTANG
jgi:hypothetical protein